MKTSIPPRADVAMHPTEGKYTHVYLDISEGKTTETGDKPLPSFSIKDYRTGQRDELLALVANTRRIYEIASLLDEYELEMSHIDGSELFRAWITPSAKVTFLIDTSTKEVQVVGMPASPVGNSEDERSAQDMRLLVKSIVEDGSLREAVLAKALTVKPGPVYNTIKSCEKAKKYAVGRHIADKNENLFVAAGKFIEFCSENA